MRIKVFLVKQDITYPTGVIANVSDALTCKTTRVNLTATSTSGNVSYNWGGPDNQTSTESSFYVSIPGTYKVKLTNQANGCSVIKQVMVMQDTVAPVVTVYASGDITCEYKTVKLNGNSLIKGLTYNWNGPGNFISTSAIAEVKLPDTYYVTVTNPVNGCITKKSVEVKQNITPPENITATVSGMLSCEQPKVELNASAAKNAIFSWNGPKDFRSDKKNPSTSFIGTYTLIATDPLNGCKSQTTITVKGDECLKKQN